MSDNDSQSGASVAAQHLPNPLTFYVAPTEGSTSFNTIRIPLVPVACWRLNDPAFAFDSSFVGPNFRGELTTLSGVVTANQGCPAALFGHCDPAGDDALNKTLGDRRAIAIYALLTRQPELWEDLYKNPAVGDTWGTRAIQTMLAVIVDSRGIPYYAGAWDGTKGPETTDGVKRFQEDAGLTNDGDPGPQTRKALFGAYMDWLCTSDLQPPPSSDAGGSAGAPPAQGTPFRMQATDFLGGTGAQPGDLPKMSLQSCGKYNPVVLLSNAEMSGSDKATRNKDDAANRRVLMFFFAKETNVDVGAWPCPKVKEANDACKASFWTDGDKRRQNGDAQRRYEDTHDTMACKVYDRFARRSPCEKKLTPHEYPFDLPPQKRYVPPQSNEDGEEDLRIASNDPSFVPGPGRTSSPPLPAADGAANYAVVTTVTRPNIVFDHGFLDSNDGKHNLDGSKRRKPTASDYAALVKWRIKLTGAQTLRPDLVDATNAYEHFLSATGTDWHFDYEKVASDDDSGKTILASTIADVVEAASFLNHSRGVTASQKTDEFTIESTDAIPVGDSVRYPYPATEDWQKAIGAHVVWVEAFVQITTDATDRRLFVVDMTIHAEDQYNFNPGMKDIATGIPDSDNGRFEVTGLAKEFRSVSTLKRKITFSEDASFVPILGATPAPSDLKTTQPR